MPFTTVRTEGALLPPDLLARVAADDRSLDGLAPADYHLVAGERLGERITRSWNRLTTAWSSLRDALDKVPADEPAVGITRERFLLPLFAELDFGRLQPTPALDVAGRDYPVSHGWGAVPVHLVGAGVPLDRRSERVAGAARSSPHALVQELLNRDDTRLWGIVSNGRVLRLLRDNVSLTRQAYVEFDLEALFEGEVYADFVLLWMLAHQSRLETASGRGDDCWLERWFATARTEGTRALDQLRGGVEAAITALGGGFLAHPANTALRESLRSSELDRQDYYRQLLRVVYRFLILFVAEDRELLADADTKPDARERYDRWYSTARLRRLAQRRRGDAHDDLWEAHRLVVTALADPAGCPDLALPPLGGLLFSPDATPALDGCRLANRALLDAVRSLAVIADRATHRRRPVDYRNLGAEELGGIYEGLLELHPRIDADAATFDLGTAAGHERKQAGAYYTPTTLITELLNTALDPVLDEAASADEPEDAILALRVVDPACGSGHFLVAAAHRIAKRLAAVRTGDDEPAPDAQRSALRDVIGRCLHGVDLNPMAAELCKVNLWLEALEPGKPLGFLDHHVVVGNSLLGTTPALIARGLPDDAFKEIEGDERTVAKSYRARNKAARKGQQSLLTVGGNPTDEYRRLATAAADLTSAPDDTPAAVETKAARHADLLDSPEYRHGRLLADAWCAAFVWPKTRDAPDPPDHGLLQRLAGDPDFLNADTRAEVERLAAEYQFLHWHLAFPHVFTPKADNAIAEDDPCGWTGGFHVVLGNPPWERVKLQEKEFFAALNPAVANAPNAAVRRRLIDALAQEDPALHGAFLAARRQAEGASHFARLSGRYPLCGTGDVNTYTVFAESMRAVTGPTGRTGVIVPSGIATDATTAPFFRDLVEQRSLVALYDFENRDKIFPAVDSRVKFCLLTLTGPGRPAAAAEFVFFAHRPADLADPDRRFPLNPADFALLNPNTHTCPVFRTRHDAELTKAIYRRVPVLLDDTRPDGNPWGVTFSTMFHMSNDSQLFRTRDELEAEGWALARNVFRRGDDEMLPLYEAKMASFFDHRAADVVISQTAVARQAQPDYLSDSDHGSPSRLAMPRSWVAAKEVADRLAERWDRDWLLGWCDITSATNGRTVIAAVIPRVAVGNQYPLMLLDHRPDLGGCLAANLSAFALDYAARQKAGGTHLNFFIYSQLPVLPPGTYNAPAPWDPGVTLAAWVTPRVLELTYTAWDLAGFARDVGWDGPPFRWDPERRFRLRCELDAAFFHLYGIERDDVAYIMDTFPIVARHDEKAHGEYRTKRVILDLYDALAKATETGTPYETVLTPPPAHPSTAHPPRS